MPISADIYSQLRQPEPFNPLAELAQFEQLKSLQQQNKLGQLAFGDRERAMADAAAQRTAVQGFGADTAKNYQSLLGTGNLPAAQAYQKSLTDQAHVAGQTGKDVAATAGMQQDQAIKAHEQHLQKLSMVSDPQQYMQWLNDGVQARVFTPEEGQAGAQMIQEAAAQGPQALADLKQKAMNGGVSALEQLKMKAEQAKQAEQQRQFGITSTETQRAHMASNATAIENNRRSVGATYAGQAQNERASLRADARAQSDPGISRAEKEADRKAVNVDKEVTKFSGTLQKEGIPELETAVAGAEGALGRYPKGQVPGIGAVKNVLPAALMSDEGKDVRQALAQVRNIVLSARSGAAVTDQELRRLVEEVGTGAGMSEADIRRGLTKIRQRVDSIKTNAAAGVSEDVKRTYEERGGIPIARAAGAPAVTAAGGWTVKEVSR